MNQKILSCLPALCIILLHQSRVQALPHLQWQEENNVITTSSEFEESSSSSSSIESPNGQQPRALYVQDHNINNNNTNLYSISQVGDDIDGDNYYDFSGTSVSLSANGEYLAVGAIGARGYAGHVRVFALDHDTQSWTSRGQELVGVGGGDESGKSVSMSYDGMRLAVGSPYHRNYYGHTRVFEFQTSSQRWVQLGRDIDGQAKDGENGYSVALSGDGTRLAIGAPNDKTLTGHVQIFEFTDNNDEWVQLGATIVGNDYYSGLGNSVALSDDGERIVIGSWFDEENGQRLVGAVSVFEYSHTTTEWVLLGSELNGQTYYEIFGKSVDISGDGSRIVIGTPNAEDDEGLKNVGKAEVFSYDSDEWVPLGNIMKGDEEFEKFGISVSISNDGDRIVVGSELSDKGGRNAGTTWVFQYKEDSNEWLQIGNSILGEFEGDKSGRSVAISANGSHFAIGAPLNSYYTGHTRVFEITTNDDTNESSEPSSSPTDLPSQWPTIAPSTMPTVNPSAPNNGCQDSESLLRVEVTTDGNGSKDNFFGVSKYFAGTGRFSKRVWQKKNLQSSTSEIYEKCLPVNECFIFAMRDKSGDGMCCESGRGSLKVTWDGDVIRRTKFKTGKRVKTPRFGDACDAMNRSNVKQDIQKNIIPNELINSESASLVAGCMDSDPKVYFKWPVGEKTRYRSCKYVKKKASLRCRNSAVASMCPLTCGKCFENICKDGELPWKKSKLSCDWVAKKPSVRCKSTVNASVCRKACHTPMSDTLCTEN